MLFTTIDAIHLILVNDADAELSFTTSRATFRLVSRAPSLTDDGKTIVAIRLRPFRRFSEIAAVTLDALIGTMPQCTARDSIDDASIAEGEQLPFRADRDRARCASVLNAWKFLCTQTHEVPNGFKRNHRSTSWYQKWYPTKLNALFKLKMK